MIDGLTIEYTIPNFEAWKEAVNIPLFTQVGTDTGNIRVKKRENIIITTHYGKWENLDLIVKEVRDQLTGKDIYYLKIKGSLHKNYYAGANYLPFSFDQLQDQINHLCRNLHISAETAKISSLETGLNVSPSFDVTPFIRQNIINYKGNPFNRYNPGKDGKILGIYCPLTQYTVKIYDKGLQFDLPQQLLRFELRFLKMQALNKLGIKHLQDLQDRGKVYELQNLILAAWKNLLVYDIPGSLRTYTLTPSEKELLTKGRDPKYWEQLKVTHTGEQYKHLKNKFKNLCVKYGNLRQSEVYNLLQNEWEKGFIISPNLPSGKTLVFPDLTIKIKGKNRENELQPLTRYCKGCGKELNPLQKATSLFCSAKYVGEATAHKCRNENSNPRNNLKRKITIIEGRGVLFDIRPFLIVHCNTN